MKKEELKFYDLFYLFIFGCVFGWVVEVIWSLFKRHAFYNHSALVIGPFNVIYGVGTVLLTLILYRLKDSDYTKIFTMSFITGSIIEYVTSFLMEHTLGFIPWNYSSKFMNINGRICLVYSIFWGFLGIVWIKLIYPFAQKMIDKTNHNVGKKMIWVLTIFLILDFALTMCAVHRAKEFEKGIEPQNKFEIFLDENFGLTYLITMYNNRWNKK